MLRSIIVLATLLMLTLPAMAGPQTDSDPLYVVRDYAPSRDPAADVADAVTRARAEHKRILLVIGGQWCGWCHVLDRFITQNQDVHDAFAQSFVVVKVNYSAENENAAFLSAFPESDGYPDFIILDSDGRFLARQETGVLEQGNSYNRARLIAFARAWQMR